MYQCVATAGEAGSLQAAAQLIVTDNVPPTSSSGSPSAPTELAAPIVSLDFLTLSWRQPDDLGRSDVSGYSVVWTEQGSSRQRELNTTQLEANIQHLKSATKYTLRVFAINSNGYSESPAQIVVQTQSEASIPDSPANLQVVAQSPTSILVTWNPPLNSAADILGYSVCYYDVGSAATIETELNVTATMCTLSDLRKFHQYSVRVVAFNANGMGTSTQEVNCRTHSDGGFILNIIKSCLCSVVVHLAVFWCL
jgi:predicted phage tail protein